MKAGEICGICGIRRASYLCQGCQRRICEACYDLEKGLCIDCSSLPKFASSILGLRFERILSLGIALTMLGIFLMAISSIFRIWGSGSGGGIVIAIGPFPIVIGEKVSPDIVAFIGILLTLLTFGLIVIPILRRIRIRKERKAKRASEPPIPVPEESIEGEASRGLKDYLIALSLPNLDEGSLSIRILGRDLRIEASYLKGERITKTYRFPREFLPSAYEYSYDRGKGLLIIRVSLVSSRAPKEA
ncbi:B-box zinc finger protein [Candidatus Bathyarchaeota archaeon]|nr:B-box zinc finger protein [Candidatus Bathyarchaeota archaeon]MBS7627787.1 B-box zinc finger protein [Candidatus Bathyarchaeota archaeon]